MKVDTKNFVLNNMLAKLLIIQRAYDQQRVQLLNDRALFDKFITEQCEKHFIFSDKASIEIHLSLFVLGNKNSQFTQLVNQSNTLT